MSVEPTEYSFQASSARIAYFEWGEKGAPAVLFIHATGFHARCWDATIAALPKGYRSIAVDMRGHGRSEKTGFMSDWSIVAKDVGELIEHLSLKDAIGVGHSMGGHCVTQVAASHPGAFKRLLLVDPVMMPPEVYASGRFAGLSPKDHPISRRRNSWASWEEMFEHLKKRHPYSLWRQNVLADYCRYGLTPKADGAGLELACPPLIEASIYIGAANCDIYAMAAKVEVPVVVLRAKTREANDSAITDFSGSPTWEKVAQCFKHGRDVPLPELTHFIPMQEPELTARFVADANYTP
jgi:pimeloyl-ACP methyl ester carboxylesterase